MVDDVLDLFTVELMQDRHCNGSVGECGEKSHCPVGGISTADGYLVSLFDVAVLKQDVEFLNLTCYIVILEGNALIVCQRILIPVFHDRPLYICIKTTESFH